MDNRAPTRRSASLPQAPNTSAGARISGNSAGPRPRPRFTIAKGLTAIIQGRELREAWDQRYLPAPGCTVVDHEDFSIVKAFIATAPLSSGSLAARSSW